MGGRKERRCLGGNAEGPWERARVLTPKGGVPGTVVWKEEPLQAGCSRTESGPGDSIREDKKDDGHIPPSPSPVWSLVESVSGNLELTQRTGHGLEG